MKDNTVVIVPSAKCVPNELQYLGELPAVVYPLNSRISFDYIYERYKNNEKIIVACCEKIDVVRQRLKTFCDKNVEICELPELKDLGYTVLKAIENITSPITINFADTIIMDSFNDQDNDYFFYNEDFISNKWSFYELENGVISKVIDKKECNSGEIGKLFVGLFHISNTQCFKQCLIDALKKHDDNISSFYNALIAYSQKHPFCECKSQYWFDIGHFDNYNDSLIAVKSREFNHISVDENRGILKKTSENKDKFIGEILWYLKLPADVEYVRPRIFSYSTDYANPYITMEYYDYHTIHELFLYGDLSYNQWSDVFKRILFVIKDLKKYSVQGENLKKSLEEMYLTKTIERLYDIKDDIRFSSFFSNPITVNNTKYLSLTEIINVLKDIIPKMLYEVDRFNIIHGDLCFSNIMIDSKFSFVKLIDPRGKFGEYDIYGDERYELAKLFHSIDGKYDYIIKDMFDLVCSTNEASITYRFVEKRIGEFDLFKLFLKVFEEEIKDDFEKILLIESILFLSMIPLHKESYKHQMLMLATGIEILNRIIDIKYGD